MINIDEIVDLVNSLEHEDEKLGAQDALQKILEARMAEATLGGGGTVDIKPPEEIEVDPDLEEIEIEGGDDIPDDTEYDDPEELLKRKEDSDSDDVEEFDDGDSDESDDADSEKETETDDEASGKDESSDDDDDGKDSKGSKDSDEESDKAGGSGDSEDDSDDKTDKDADAKSDSKSDTKPGKASDTRTDHEKVDDIKSKVKSDGKEADSEKEESEEEKSGKSDGDSDPSEEKAKGGSDTSDESGEDEQEFDMLGDEEEEEEVDDSDLGGDIDDSFTDDEDKYKERRRQIGEASAIKDIAKQILKKHADELTAEQKEQIEKIIEDMDSILNNPEPMEAEEFNDKINKALDIVDKIVDVKYFDEEENKERLNDIEREIMDPIYADELETEDESNKAEDPTAKKLKAREAEKKRIKDLADKEAAAATESLAKFKQDLKQAIGEQIGKWQEIEEPTYAKVDRHHEDDDMAAPGYYVDEIPEEEKPSVDVYIDQSGSWQDSDVRIALNAVAELLKFEDEELLDLNIFYFSEFLSTDRAYARRHGRYECWDLIIEQICAKPKTKNVVMITDHDIGIDWHAPGCHGCKVGPSVTVDGCVWFLWKNGSREPMAPAKLRGKQGTFQYQFKGSSW